MVQPIFDKLRRSYVVKHAMMTLWIGLNGWNPVIRIQKKIRPKRAERGKQSLKSWSVTWSLTKWKAFFILFLLYPFESVGDFWTVVLPHLVGNYISV